MELVELILDRPFCYAIVDLERGVPLFLGTFERPNGGRMISAPTKCGDLWYAGEKEAGNMVLWLGQGTRTSCWRSW